MPTSTYDIIVLGVGSMGAATCWQLTRKYPRKRVLGLEQFDIPNTRASHGGGSRVIRLAYFEHPDYVALLRRAYENWEALRQQSGQQVLHLTGGLYLGRPDCDLVAGSIQAAQLHGLPHEVIERRDLARRFPQFHVPDDAIGFYEAGSGLVLPELTVGTCARLALENGAELHAHEPAHAWEADGGGVKVTTAHGVYEAERLVITAGPWAAKLLGDLQLELTVTRQVLAWFWPKRPELFSMGALPCWGVDLGTTDGHEGVLYGFPMWDGSPSNPGLKAALHQPGEPCDPDDAQPGARPGDEAPVRDALSRRLPDAAGPLLALRTCFYTNSPDGHFIIDRHPRFDSVTLACGFSGHGFKFVSVIGEALADLAAAGDTPHPIGFLNLKRFQRV